MITAIRTKPSPLPAILVYGTPSGPALTQASWFRAEDKDAVRTAAKELKFSVIELQTDADRALAAGAQEGVLKGSGRMIVGSVSAEVYRRIEEHVRKADPGAAQPKDATSTTTRSMSEQSMNTGASEPSRASTGAPLPTTGKQDSAGSREALRIGARVLAAYWNEKREFDGFWLATVKRIEPDEYTLEWFGSPGISTVQEPAKGHRRPASRVPRHGQVAAANETTTTIIILFARGGLRVAPLVPRAPEFSGRDSMLKSLETKAMTSTTLSTAERIRALNDAFRRTFVGGAVMITAGVEALPVEQRRMLLDKVRAFDVFTADNDPHGEHDFGAIDEGGVRCFWKIDCYDRATEFGPPSPRTPPSPRAC